jgi:hypothetical protein
MEHTLSSLPAVTLVSVKGETTVFKDLSEAVKKASSGDTLVLEPGMHLQPSSSVIIARKAVSIVSRGVFSGTKEADGQTMKETLIVGRERGRPVISVTQRGSLRMEGVSVVFFPKSFILFGNNDEEEGDEGDEDEENFEKYDAVVDVKSGSLIMKHCLITGKICHGLVVRSGSCTLEDVCIDGMPRGLFSSDDYSEADLTLLHGIIIAPRVEIVTIADSSVQHCFWYLFVCLFVLFCFCFCFCFVNVFLFFFSILITAGTESTHLLT